MDKTSRSTIASLLWCELQKASHLKTWFAYNSQMTEVMDNGYIIFGTATDEETSQRINEKTRWGERQDYVYSPGEPEVELQLKELRKTARKLGWTIKQAHRSWWPSYGVVMWVLCPSDERDQNDEFFRSCNW